jgi:hypothetical protein
MKVGFMGTQDLSNMVSIHYRLPQRTVPVPAKNSL